MARHNNLLKKWLDDVCLRPYHVTYLSSKSQNEFIDLLGKQIKLKIVNEINNCSFFTIMADHTPDASNKDILSIVIRTVDASGVPQERLLGVVEAVDKTGAGTAQQILDTLYSYHIDVSKLAFQSYDFASAMSGKFNGTQKKISDLLGREIPYVPCQAHRTNTAIEHCSKSSRLVTDMFNILEELYVFFNSSTKRYQTLNANLQQIENSLSLKNLSKTRWTARAETLNAVNISMEIIIKTLEDISTSVNVDSSTKGKAYGLFKRILNFDFICCLMFLKTVFLKMKIVTKILESDKLNVIDAFSIINSVKNTLQTIRSNPVEVNNLIEASKTFAASLDVNADEDFKRHHRRKVIPKKFDQQNENAALMDINAFYRHEFFQVLDILISFLEKNLSELLKIIQPFVKIFSFPLSKTAVMDSKNIEAAILLFPSNKPDPASLQGELEVFFDICIEKNVASMEDVMKIAIEQKYVFKDSFLFCQLIYTAAFSVATNERKFSTLKFVKNMLRTTMANDRLDFLMSLKSERDITDNIELTDVIESWTKLKDRRLRVQTK